jgi:hypothetical protein
MPTLPVGDLLTRSHVDRQQGTVDLIDAIDPNIATHDQGVVAVAGEFSDMSDASLVQLAN